MIRSSVAVLLSWFFLLAGSGGSTVIGPFDSYDDCQAYRRQINQSLSDAGYHGFRCWEDRHGNH